MAKSPKGIHTISLGYLYVVCRFLSTIVFDTESSEMCQKRVKVDLNISICKCEMYSPFICYLLAASTSFFHAEYFGICQNVKQKRLKNFDIQMRNFLQSFPFLCRYEGEPLRCALTAASESFKFSFCLDFCLLEVHYSFVCL